MRVLIHRQCALATAHILALRENPAYFAQAVQEWSEHQQGLIPDSRGQIDLPPSQFFEDRVVQEVIRVAYMSMFIWEIILEQVESLIECQEKYSPFIDKRPVAYPKTCFHC